MSDDDRRDRLATAGEWLRTQRVAHGYRTAGALARELGVDPSRISQYERGMSAVPDDRAEQIAQVLRMDVIEVRRNLGLWVPPTQQSGEESGVEDALEQLLAADRTQLSTEELIDRIGKLMDLAREYIRYVQDESA